MTSVTPATESSDIESGLRSLLQAQRQAFEKEGQVSYETRVDRLNRCISLLVDNQDALCEALQKDFGCRSRYVTLMSEIMTCIGSLKSARKQLKGWMKPERRKAPFPMNLFGANARVYYQPKGVVGIMSPWNVPIGTVFSPLTDILAAGNRCMIKPSEFTPHTAELLAETFPRYFDATEVTVCTGGAEVGAAFSNLPLDHLIFTGSTTVGRHVMRAAAENLTPVTLELGGKSPVIVSETIDAKVAAESIISGKAMNGGQLCISPDYAFVPEAGLEVFIQQCQATISEQFPTIADNPDFVAVVNERHFDRINGYLQDAESKGARIVALMPAGESFDDRSKHKIPLHLVINPTDDMQVMQDEIFGPILTIKTYRSVDECLAYINNRPRPLALYYYGKDAAEQERVLQETTSGGVSVNDIAMHYACDDLPFGGVGASGMGHFHGFDGFKTFSHAKGVFKQGRLNLPKLMGTLPPYGDKLDKLLSGQIKN
ncbi:MAG: coniferyl aldehyde dehydrogenase [Halieaceae bacterium]|jgi:coniferyl-aldehyde dehydrogenase|nr:coniferyl aldehyde dehydrogenase [Halieaceae bacterium]